MAKKSYNPFLMWGSYVGAITLLSGWAYFLKCPPDPLLLNPGCNSWNDVVASLTGINNIGVDAINNGWGNIYLPYTLLTLGIVLGGFLIGWGIHSLIRAVRTAVRR